MTTSHLEAITNAILTVLLIATFVFVLGGMALALRRAVKTAQATSDANRRPAATDDDASRERRRTLCSLAERNGWQFIARDDTYLDLLSQYVFQGNWDVAHPLDKRPLTGRRCENILVGDYHGHRFIALDMMICRSVDMAAWTGPMRTHHKQHDRATRDEDSTVQCFSVVLLRTGAVMPSMQVIPETTAVRAATTVLGGDFDLESEEFNRRHTVRASNKRFASDLLHPRLMQTLLALPPQRWEVLGPDLATIRRDDPFDEQTLTERLDLLDLILHDIPDHTWRMVAGDVPTLEPRTV